MRPRAVVGALLLAFGLVALAYQGITYKSRDTVVDIGPIHATAEREHTLPVPPILGAIAVIGGVVLLLGGVRNRV